MLRPQLPLSFLWVPWRQRGFSSNAPTHEHQTKLPAYLLGASLGPQTSLGGRAKKGQRFFREDGRIPQTKHFNLISAHRHSCLVCTFRTHFHQKDPAKASNSTIGNSCGFWFKDKTDKYVSVLYTGRIPKKLPGQRGVEQSVDLRKIVSTSQPRLSFDHTHQTRHKFLRNIVFRLCESSRCNVAKTRHEQIDINHYYTRGASCAKTNLSARRWTSCSDRSFHSAFFGFPGASAASAPTLQRTNIRPNFRLTFLGHLWAQRHPWAGASKVRMFFQHFIGQQNVVKDGRIPQKKHFNLISAHRHSCLVRTFRTHFHQKDPATANISTIGNSCGFWFKDKTDKYVSVLYTGRIPKKLPGQRGVEQSVDLRKLVTTSNHGSASTTCTRRGTNF